MYALLGAEIFVTTPEDLPDVLSAAADGVKTVEAMKGHGPPV